MYPLHKVMKMLTPCGHPQALIELIHQPGFAPPHRPPQIHAIDRLRTRVQGLMAALQGLDCNPLGGIVDKALVFDSLLIGIKGGHDIHIDKWLLNQRGQYASQETTQALEK